MESNLAKQAKLAAIKATQQFSPEERLNAFLSHCELMAELQKAGQQLVSDAIQESS